jgi:hypothetical protein
MVGCGGSGDSSLFGRTGGPGGALAGGGGHEAGGVGGNTGGFTTGGASNAGGIVSAGGITGGRGSGGVAVGASNGFVRCGTESCRVPDEVCCSESTSNGTRDRCSSSTQGCERAFACDNHGDCNQGEQCCLSYAGTSLSPSTSCQSNCSEPFECGAASDCGAGQVCCGLGIDVVVGTLYTAVACQDTCGSAPNYPLCGGGSPCPGGTSCQESTHFPTGYPVCK